MLFTFPSRYSFTIGLVLYLALESGLPRFPRAFACPVVLRYWLKVLWILRTRLSRSLVCYSEQFCYPLHSYIVNPTTLPPCGESLGCSAFARRYLRNGSRQSRDMFSFPRVTKMFQFTRLPILLLYRSAFYKQICLIRLISLIWFTECEPCLQQIFPIESGWVAPFGNRRIIREKLFPDEYRRFMRPSSAKQA